MQKIGKGYKAVQKVGYHDGHFWRACGGLGGVHALNEALGAAFGCDGETGTARRGLAHTEYGYEIYRAGDNLLYAVHALDAWQVEEVA